MDGFTILSYDFNSLIKSSDFDYKTLSFIFFVLGLIVFGLIEHYSPFKKRRISQTLRWTHNLGLVAINNLFMKILIPLSLTTALSFGETFNLGFFRWIQWPFYIEFLLSLILLDLTIYWQHRFFHKFSLLWRLHSVHHADLDFDVTTGLRFHTIEIFFSFLIKWIFVFIFTPPLLAIFVFEVLLNLSSIFNHMNFEFSEKLDRIIRKVIVTPNMHRIHHSIDVKEQNRNFGFNLSIWDKIFDSFLEKSRYQNEIPIGLSYAQNENMTVKIPDMLKFPFLSQSPTPPNPN